MAQNEFFDHDYPTTWGDRFLEFIKMIVSDPEVRHHRLDSMAKYAKYLPRPKLVAPLNYQIKFNDKSKPLTLSSPFILPAGANKFGENLPDFANLGLGGLTVGTATKSPREGNSFRPRVRMLPEDRGIQNSMGLNNPGIDVLAEAVDRNVVKCQKAGMAMGLSIGETPGLVDDEEKIADLIYTFRKAYNSADYVEINVSCPNTGHQRVDTQTKYLDKLFQQIIQIRKSLPVRKAVYAKISPDMGEKQLLATLEVIKEHGFNGLVLFNTFPGARAKYLDLTTPLDQIRPVAADGALGGLSGRALYTNTFRAVEFIKNKYPEFSIMASGGVDHGAKAWDLIRAGADAVQSYSVIAYRWQAFHKMKAEFANELNQAGFHSMEEWVESKHPL